MAAYRILSLDGGGIRGLYAAALLQRLAREVGGFLDKVDLLAGTSTGGIIALGLASGFKPGKLVTLYRTKAVLAQESAAHNRAEQLRCTYRLVREC